MTCLMFEAQTHEEALQLREQDFPRNYVSYAHPEDYLINILQDELPAPQYIFNSPDGHIDEDTGINYIKVQERLFKIEPTPLQHVPANILGLIPSVYYGLKLDIDLPGRFTFSNYKPLYLEPKQ